MENTTINNKDVNNDVLVIDTINMKQYWYTLKDQDGKSINISDFHDIIFKYLNSHTHIITEKVASLSTMLDKDSKWLDSPSFVYGYVTKAIMDSMSLKLDFVSSSITQGELNQLTSKAIDDNIAVLNNIKKKLKGDKNGKEPDDKNNDTSS